MIRLAAAIIERLEREEPLVLATILTHAGSTPRTSGAKMIICADGGIEGTIGGGLVEAEVMGAAAKILGSSTAVIRTYDLGLGNRADTMDMLCGGRLDVLLEPIAPTAETLGFYRRVAGALAGGGKGLIVTRLPTPGTPRPDPARHLVDAGGTSAGDAPLPEEITATVIAAALGQRAQMTHPRQNPRYLLEPLSVPGIVILLGAGHVSQAVAALTRMVGFRTVVRDDRKEFANRQRFPTADSVEVIPSFEKALSNLEIDADSYLVIVTRGHRHDGTVLGLALSSAAGYIGMIGSRRKRDAIYQDMRALGFTSGDIDRVHSPIGLSIAAETPEEIAVSIVAELIQVRAATDKGHANATSQRG